MLATESVTPALRCQRESPAGMKPEESAVEPLGDASRSSTTHATPASRKRSAAMSPPAPPPMTITCTVALKSAACSAITAMPARPP